IRWQSLDFLPWEEDDTVLDWKVVGEDSENFSILFVAVRKRVLFGYVNAVSAAGLFPIVVETPSLSLARVSKTGEVGKFIFYGGKHSSVFIIAKGENIIGSSVVYTYDLDDIYTTSSRMAEHYKNIQIDSVEIDGPAATSDVAEKLSKLFKKEAV